MKCLVFCFEFNIPNLDIVNSRKIKQKKSIKENFVAEVKMYFLGVLNTLKISQRKNNLEN